MDRAAAEPEPRAVGAPGLGLEPDVVEAIVLALKRCRRVAPQHRPGRQVLVEQHAAALERHAQRRVLVAVPAHRRQHHQPPARKQVERRQLLGQQQRVAQRRDDRGGGEPDSGGGRGHRAEQHDRARPRHRRVLVAGQRVVARVAHDALARRARPEDEVLAEHDRVRARRLHLDRHRHQRVEGARIDERPLLGEDDDELRLHGPKATLPASMSAVPPSTVSVAPVT